MGNAVTQFERAEDRLPIKVFVVSPNSQVQQELHEKLGLPRWQVIRAGGGAEALQILHQHGGGDGVLLLDPKLPDLESVEFNGIVRDRYPNTQVLMLNSHTGQLLIGSASPTPVSSRLVDAVNRSGEIKPGTFQANEPLGAIEIPDRTVKLRGIIGNSEAMMRIATVTRMVAVRDTTVLITGENGTGKDLIAQEIHLISQRRKQPFIVVNCSAIPEALLEAELFGYVKGSFTGAVQSRIGRVHAAHGGTLFLDEIGDLPVSLQSKLLRFLEQGEVQRLGGNDNLKVDVRVVAATNADLKKRIIEQQFREDLFYRLAVFPIHLPPLRERLDDLPELAHSFVTKFLPRVSLSREAIHVLQQHRWPGNVRELRNAIERATILVGTGDEIRPEHILL
jgi:transcriptional regulator with GAF, ATPase, and Fis domain